MKVNVAKSAGFCFGVRRALRIARELANSGAKIEMLGDVVHNEKVVKEINRAGIRKVYGLHRVKDTTLLIRAHGAPAKTFEKARNLGYTIVDATCPMVKEIHTIAMEMEKKGYRIIIIGDKKHDEVRGIIGQLKNKAIVIDNLKDIPIRRIKRIAQAAVVVQSTQIVENVNSIVEKLKTYICDLKFFNTICKPTRIKQKEVKVMPLQNDVMVIIGSKTSANTKRLYEISKSLNKRSYWIQSKDEVKLDWFKNARSVGITAGASTPDSTTKEVVEYIKKIP